MTFFFEHIMIIVSAIGALIGGLFLGSSFGKRKGKKEGIQEADREGQKKENETLKKNRDLERHHRENSNPDNLSDRQRELRDKYGQDTD
jgi:uncharacterized protein YcfJ